MVFQTTLRPLLAAVAVGLAAPSALAEGHYIDTDGERTAFEPTYDSWFGPDRYERRYVRAIGENVGILAFELFIYWYNPRESVVDWEYPNIASKLTSNSLVRLDDNMHRTNMFLHPMAGASHYLFTRANGFGILPSFGAAAVSSGLYEVFFEWREIISINDLIVTPFAGMAAGEFLYQLGEYLNSQVDRPRRLDEYVGAEPFSRRLASRTLGLPRALHNRFDDPPSPTPVPDDNLGLSSAFFHEFRLLSGADILTNDDDQLGRAAVLQLSGELFAMPGFLRPGEISKWYTTGNRTATKARVSFSSRVRDLDVTFDSHLFGHFEQHLERKKEGLFGHAREFAGFTRLNYVDRWLFDRRDYYATLEPLGAVANYWIPSGHTMLRLTGSLAPHFAQIRSLAYPAWVSAFGEEGTKSSLKRHGYYNAWGGTARVAAELETRGGSVELGARYGRYESIDGIERFREDVTREVHMTDDVIELRVGLGYDPPDTSLTTRLTMTHIGRRSRMAPFTHDRYDQRLGFSAGVRF